MNEIDNLPLGKCSSCGLMMPIKYIYTPDIRLCDYMNICVRCDAEKEEAKKDFYHPFNFGKRWFDARDK